MMFACDVGSVALAAFGMLIGVLVSLLAIVAVVYIVRTLMHKRIHLVDRAVVAGGAAGSTGMWSMLILSLVVVLMLVIIVLLLAG